MGRACLRAGGAARGAPSFLGHGNDNHVSGIGQMTPRADYRRVIARKDRDLEVGVFRRLTATWKIWDLDFNSVKSNHGIVLNVHVYPTLSCFSTNHYHQHHDIHPSMNMEPICHFHAVVAITIMVHPKQTLAQISFFPMYV